MQGQPGQFIIRSSVPNAANRKGSNKELMLSNAALMLSKLVAAASQSQVVIENVQALPKTNQGKIYLQFCFSIHFIRRIPENCSYNV